MVLEVAAFSHLRVFLQVDDLLQLILHKLFQVVNHLVPCIVAQDDVKLGKRRLIFVKRPLHEGVVLHQRL